MLTCPICSQSYYSLVSHVRKHGFKNGAEFRVKYPEYPLFSKELRETQRENFANWAKTSAGRTHYLKLAKIRAANRVKKRNLGLMKYQQPKKLKMIRVGNKLRHSKASKKKMSKTHKKIVRQLGGSAVVFDTKTRRNISIAAKKRVYREGRCGRNIIRRTTVITAKRYVAVSLMEKEKVEGQLLVLHNKAYIILDHAYLDAVDAAHDSQRPQMKECLIGFIEVMPNTVSQEEDVTKDSYGPNKVLR